MVLDEWVRRRIDGQVDAVVRGPVVIGRGTVIRMAGIVLAGGQSRRIGQDKAFLELQGRPLVRWISERLQQAGLSPVLVVAPPSRLERLVALGLRAVADTYEERGPLAGLHAGLTAAGAGHHFVISCDQPFFEPRVVRYLLERAGHPARSPGEAETAAPGWVDAIVPRAAGHLQVLHAVYHSRAAGPAEQLLQSGELRLYKLLEHLNWIEVGEEQLRTFGDPARMFFNVNTPEDVEVMRRF